MDPPENKPPILHILVVGFHHKLGCQVEFSHPPLIAGSTGRNECPSGWKYLPTLALPDGSHNFIEDSVFFNLPSLIEPTESIYGVSCYRQIPVEKLKIRTADVTRSTVQKSVCILARLPIYGYIEVKLSLIADAFFDQGDFSCTQLLLNAYTQLNACLLDDESRRPLRHFHVGLSLREIVLHWRATLLLLFKLFLLQRRVVCFGSPVRSMCALILGVSSLIPRLLEKGFQEVACVRTSRPLSPMPDFTDCIQREAAAAQQERERERELTEGKAVGRAAKNSPPASDGSAGSAAEALSNDESALISSAASAAGSDDSSRSRSPQSQKSNSTRELDRSDSTGLMEVCVAESGQRLTREASVDTLASQLCALAAVNPDDYRAPISIFASGNLCLPYLSLPYMDLLSDPSVLSYVIGTSNVLFRQKRQLADVLVDIENASVETHDAELRRQLVLTTEDLRFMDFLLRHVQMPKEDAEGSEHWIRDQFQGYVLALLRTTVASDVSAKDNDHFNAHFMHAFKRTQCFQEWYDVRPEAEFFEALPVGHPFAGTLSVADMKLKIAQTMQNSESGRKLNQAVNTTSRAVGGAISQAKGAFSNWWSSITTAPTAAASTTLNGTNNDEAAATSTNGTPRAQQPQEISVTFQNSKNIDGIDEMGVSIHIDEGVRRAETVSTTGNSGSSTDGSEKPIDSAEELEEDATGVVGIVEAINKPPSEAEEATVQTLLAQQTQAATATGNTAEKAQEQSEERQGQGIVEIGHEAALLDKTTASVADSTGMEQQQQQTPAAVLTQPSFACSNDASGSADEERRSGDIFIV